MSAPPKILVARTDKLGDVLLSLPSLVYLRTALPNAQIDFLCRPALHALLEKFLKQWRVGLTSKSSEKDLAEYDAALFLFGPDALKWRLWKSGVKIRAGVWSRVSSFLLFNRGLAQHRSRAKMNEAQYNLELAAYVVESLVGKKPEISLPPIELPLNEAAKEEALAMFKGPPDFWVCHPGMGGSALNLSVEKYLSLFDFLTRSLGCPGVISQGPAERDQEIAEKLRALRPDLSFVGDLSLPALGEFFRAARLVVAPSTGPIHLAHLVGTETIGLYSPVLSQHPRRWQPWGGRARVQVLVPELDCPAKTQCLGSTCPVYFCLDGLQWGGLRFEAGKV